MQFPNKWFDDLKSWFFFWLFKILVYYKPHKMHERFSNLILLYFKCFRRSLSFSLWCDRRFILWWLYWFQILFNGFTSVLNKILNKILQFDCNLMQQNAAPLQILLSIALQSLTATKKHILLPLCSRPWPLPLALESLSRIHCGLCEALYEKPCVHVPVYECVDVFKWWLKNGTFYKVPNNLIMFHILIKQYLTLVLKLYLGRLVEAV